MAFSNSIEILSISFIDDDSLMILNQKDEGHGEKHSSSRSLTAVALPSHWNFLNVEMVSESELSIVSIIQQNGTSRDQFHILRQRDFDDSFIPISIALNGREGRRIGCILADDSQRYLIFDLDEDEEENEEMAEI